MYKITIFQYIIHICRLKAHDSRVFFISKVMCQIKTRQINLKIGVYSKHNDALILKCSKIHVFMA